MVIRRNILIVGLSFLFQILIAQNQHSELPVFEPDSIKQELKALFVELGIKHPGFYRYSPKNEFDAYIDSILTTINHPLNEFEIYRLAKPILAKVGCLHTGISLSEKTEQHLNRRPNCFPLALFYEDGKAYVWKNYGKKSDIPLGAEVISINGKPIQAIYKQLLQNVPMDGYNQTGKFKLLENSFSTWYRNVIQDTTTFSIEIKNDNNINTFRVDGVKAEVFPTYRDLVTSKLKLEIKENLAILTIPSFAKSFHKTNGQKFKKIIKGYFKQLQEKGIPNLIIDLRGNTGGSDSYAAFLASYFFDKPFRYWDRIEVTEPIAKEIKGMKRLFYGKPQQRDSIWLWKKSGWFTKEFDFYQMQQPAKNSFKGKVYILIDGLCMSSCADISAVLNYNQKAVFIGEETGGGYQGNTSGLIPDEELTSGVSISVPLLKYFNAVDAGKNFGRGTIPDIEVFDSPIEKMNGNDAGMLKVFEIIRQHEKIN